MPHFWFGIILFFFNYRLCIFFSITFNVFRFINWLIMTVVNINIIIIRSQISIITCIFIRVVKIIFINDFIIHNSFNFNIINIRIILYTRIKFNITNIGFNWFLFKIKRFIIFYYIFRIQFIINSIIFNCIMTVIYFNIIFI